VTKTVLVDTGPLVALINRRDRYHDWAKEQFSAIRPPLYTCEAVVTEACYLLRSDPKGPAAILEMVSRRLLIFALRIDEHTDAIVRLMARYASVPMDLADACLVRATEIHESPLVLTVDDDFLIYRRHGRQRISTIMPTK
jgi:predicted nucleic acid-binding protein